ncbi:MAG: hypothetical protein ACKOB3_05555, partial [Holophagaceae bacterium]
AGQKILPSMEQGIRPAWFNPKTHTAIQRRPSSYQWKHVWSKFCAIIQNSGQQLGKWKSAKTALRLRRETYLHGNIVYHWHAGCYWECEEANFAEEQILKNASEWTPTETSIPIDTIARILNTVYCDMGNLRTSPAQYPIPTDFEEYAALQPPPIRNLLSNITWKQLPYQCATIISQCTSTFPLLVVSDGSAYEDKAMSYGVVIGSTTGQILLEAQGMVEGPISSHRAECMGCFAGATIIHHLSRFTEIDFQQRTHVRVISDNKGMIHSLTQRWNYKNLYTNETMKTDWDLIEEINHTYKNSLAGNAVRYEWVKGHQDKDRQVENLPWEVQFNVQADALAGQAIHESNNQHRYTTPIFSQTRCILEINKATIHGQAVYTPYPRSSSTCRI